MFVPSIGEIKQLKYISLTADFQSWEYISVWQAGFLLSVLYTGDAGSCLRGGRDPFLFWKLLWKLFFLMFNYLDNDCFCHHKQRLLPCRLCNKFLGCLCSCVKQHGFCGSRTVIGNGPDSFSHFVVNKSGRMINLHLEFLGWNVLL